MSREAWGRWGAEDEVGALNLIASTHVRLAASLIRDGRVFNLAQRLSARTPIPDRRAPMQHFMGRDGGDYAPDAKRPGGFQFAEDTLVISSHIGTHIDALCHVWTDDQLYNGFDSRNIRSTSGAAHCGIDKMPPVVGRGVLLDMVALTGGPLELGRAVTVDDIRSSLSRSAVEIEAGDIVLLRTGWLEHYSLDPDVSFETEPGLDLEAAEWLAETGVSLVGADNFAVEVMPFPNGTVFPVHQRLIRDYGIQFLEGVVLDQLAAVCRPVFCFVAAPLPIVGGTGSPITPLAIL